MAVKPLMVKVGPRSTGGQFAFRVSRDLKLVFGSDPVRVNRDQKADRVTTQRKPDGTRDSVTESVVIDLESIVRRYADAGYLEITE